jgi:transcriptional regulator with XRE-family HTH domain
MAVNRDVEASELGAGLHALRERAQMTVRGLGEKVGAGGAAVSYWERAQRLPSEDYVGKICDATGATDDERERLLGLRRRAGGPGQLTPGEASIGEQLVRFVEHEQRATTITHVAPLLIPGLLQTRDYARATLDEGRDIETRVALRIGRRDVLTRETDPAHLIAFIDSEALTRPVVSPRATAEQLRHLLEMGERTNVDIHLVASTTPGYTPMLGGAAILLDFKTAASVVHVETYAVGASLWDPEQVQRTRAGIEMIRAKAMTPTRSAEVIAELVNGMETT